MAPSDAPVAKKARTFPAELQSLRTPCCLVDVPRATANAEAMLRRAKELGVKVRPHVKTHKTLEGARLCTGGETRGIVCSTLAEVEFFAAGGFDDIIYAVPITEDKLEQAAEFTRCLEIFHIVVDSAPLAEAILARPAPAEGKKWRVALMVDCGYHRDGIDPEGPGAVALARRIHEADQAEFSGLYTHGGHSYDAKAGDVAGVRRIAAAERDAVASLAERLRAAGIPCPMVGVGSTPTCSHPPEHLQGVTEMHPGNYFMYDCMQFWQGSCHQEDIACIVLTRVLGHYPNTNMLLIDLGWTGISAQGKERGYGLIEGHPELRIVTLKQEAGEVQSADGSLLDFSRYPIGSLLRVLPFHSCAACHQHASLFAVEGERVVAEWQRARGW